MPEKDFERLNAQIEKLSSSISGLEGKIQRLKTEMGSGDFGLGQLREYESQLNKLNATLERKKTQKLELVAEKDLVPLNSILKSINTLKTKLDELYSTRGRAGSGGQLSNEFRQIEQNIKNSENALKSFQSRLRGEYARLQQGQIAFGGGEEGFWGGPTVSISRLRI